MKVLGLWYRKRKRHVQHAPAESYMKITCLHASLTGFFGLMIHGFNVKITMDVKGTKVLTLR